VAESLHNIRVIAENVRELIETLKHYPEALGKKVVGVFKIDAAICCRLQNGLIIGALFAVEHGELEVILLHEQHLPQEFRPSEPLPIQRVLEGLPFGGFILLADGNLGFRFGEYILRFVKRDRTANLSKVVRTV
jgi:hypothetical protein